jgi:translation initiation factor eIF-2B subunit delta
VQYLGSDKSIMSTTVAIPPVEVKPKILEKPQKPPETTQAPPNGESQTKGENTVPPPAPKLTGAELKAKAKAEKQARRAQVKAAKDAAPGGAPASASTAQSGHPAVDSKGNKAKGKTDGAPSASSGATGKATGSKGSVPTIPPKPESSIPECFSHLPVAKRLPITQADKDVHPTVLALGQQMATFAIDESITRLKATLLAFKKVRFVYTASTCQVSTNLVSR